MSQRANIARKYELIYSTVAAAVADFIAKSSGTPPVVYRQMKPAIAGIWATLSWAFQQRGEEPSREQMAQYVRAYLNQPMTWFERETTKSGTRAEQMSSADALYVDVIRQYVGDVDVVVDLGCGWGHRMVDLFLSGLDAEYWGGDRSLHSRDSVHHLGSLFPKMRINWFMFDFTAPAFLPIKGAAKKVALVSVGAIEQVRILGDEFFRESLQHFSNAHEVVGVHIEPTSWQIDSSRVMERAYAEKQSYNADLLAQILARTNIELICREAVLVDCRDANPSSLLVWKRTTRA